MSELYTFPLAEPQATVGTVGGKGASLARLSVAGLPVPDGFCVTTAAYRRFVEEHGLQDEILAIVSDGDPGQPASLGKASRRIGELFEGCAIPEGVAASIREAYAGLDGGDLVVAVRSSATAEDLPGMSFAGQQDTYLNMRGEAVVLDAVKRCWASLWTARAIDYRARNGIAPEEVSLAVVVQELVPAEAAGVMFTANPLTGARGEAVINAAWGLGESIVGGHVTPDTVIVDKASGTIIEQRIQEKEAMTVCVPWGTREQPVPSDQRHRAVLSAGQVAELVRLGVRIQNLYGRPMDVEWALHDGHIFIVQARPITTLDDEDPMAGQWNDSLTGDYLWTITNYGEAMPDVMTPCTWSLAQITLAEAMPTVGPIRPYGNIGGRLYGNLSAMASLMATVGIGPRRSARMIEDILGRLPEDVDIPIVALSRLPVLRGTMRGVIGSRANHRRLPAFLQSAPNRCEALRGRAQAASSPQELAALWEGAVAPFAREAFQMVEAASRQNGNALLFIRKKLHRLVGQQDGDTLLTGASGQGGQLASLGPLLGLTQLSKGEIDRATFAQTFGHRGPHELEVSMPRPAEDPDWMDKQLAGLTQANEDAGALLARQGAAREAVWHRLHETHPRKKARIRRLVDRWAAIAHEREASRSEAVRAYVVLRSFVVRAGALTGQGDDVFFLSIEEILALLAGDPTPLSIVSSRRATYQRYRALPPYPGLIRGPFDPLAWAADPHRRSDMFDASTDSQAPSSAAITGFPGSAGIAEGQVRVLMSAEEGNQLRPGEILVTTVTNVGWTPLFPRAAAVVTDVGAPLSHAAIVARELGIPAVVGCGNATMRLHTGDRVRVDGAAGTVEIVKAHDRV
ncbi:MAG: pyruvate, phosphate dikinase [Actinobacteria bacterium]|nr:pyruvate, phosphate dikinase [Actinomycetota bacterium]